MYSYSPDLTTLTIFGHRLMLCPMCGFEYTHIDQVSMVDAAGHALTITADGEDEACSMVVKPTAPQPVYARRRHAVVLLVDCEQCDNRTEIVFRQHKGQTEIETHTLPEPESLPG